jgi:hypothetical protein
VSIVA